MFDIFANTMMTATRSRTDDQLPDRYVDPYGPTTGFTRTMDSWRRSLMRGRR
ncbi:hypothetical protein [Stappia stellulata]|uniref:hypothetical protein n=1 Tax=Stappia stellulata TaxID=71235 RepID=UPI000428BA49|nr:hypothetical protein [Stappia stellulata]